MNIVQLQGLISVDVGEFWSLENWPLSLRTGEEVWRVQDTHVRWFKMCVALGCVSWCTGDKLILFSQVQLSTL